MLSVRTREQETRQNKNSGVHFKMLKAAQTFKSCSWKYLIKTGSPATRFKLFRDVFNLLANYGEISSTHYKYDHF